MNAYVVFAAFVLMEPTVALLHRTVMHQGRGWRWHASHHRTHRGPLERNDLFPVVFACTTLAVMMAGASVDTLRPLLAIGCGVTVYGAAYLTVHDGYIHGRFGALPGRNCRYLTWVRSAHAVHHSSGRAPYGFLCPWSHRAHPFVGRRPVS